MDFELIKYLEIYTTRKNVGIKKNSDIIWCNSAKNGCGTRKKIELEVLGPRNKKKC